MLEHEVTPIFIAVLLTSGPFVVLQGSLECVEGSYKVCGGHDEDEEDTGCDDSITNGNTSCICNTKQGKKKNNNKSQRLIRN